MKKILIVDDVKMNRVMIEEMLEDSYEIEQADGGMAAIMILKARYEEFGCVLLDLVMPGVDGFTVLEVMQKQKWIEKVPVIVISGENSKDTENRSLDLGASDFIRKPFDESTVRRRVRNIVDLYDYRRKMDMKVEKQEEALHDQYELLLKQSRRIQQNNEKIIEILGTVVEYRDLESGEHIQRVKGFTEILANEAMKEYPEYGLTSEQIRQIVAASSLHDVGKITIPDSILLKPGKLTKEEFDYMKSHTTRGSELLQQISGAWDDAFGDVCYDICRHHHEKYDGRGYPDGLKGEEIPLSAQIVSIADAYDALVSERVYKSAYTPQEAFHMIISGECGVFSPKLLECFRNTRKKFETLAVKQSEEEPDD